MSDQKLPLLSYSMRAAWKSCQRKVFFKYVAGVQPVFVSGPALVIGKAFHKGIEHFRKGDLPFSAVQASVDYLKASLAKETDLVDEDIEIESARLFAYLHGYRARYGDSDAKLVKKVAEFKYVDAKEIGFIDMTFVDEFGATWIIEDKTRAMFDGHVDRVLPMSEQTLNYASLLQKTGRKVGGLLYRETRKTRKGPAAGTKTKPRESLIEYRSRMLNEYTTPGESGTLENFRETKILFNDRELELFRQEQAYVDLDITSSLATCTHLHLYPRNTGECEGKWGPCDYLPLCSNLGNPSCVKDRFKPSKGEPIDGGEFKKQVFGDTPTTPDTGHGEGNGADEWWEQRD